MRKSVKTAPLRLVIALLVLMAGAPSAAAAQSGGAPGGPEVTISLVSTENLVRINSPLSVKAGFSEQVSGFTVEDITVINGAAGSFTGGDGDAVYTFDVTPDAIGTVTVGIDAGAAQDAGGDGNTASLLSLGIPYDDDGDGEISKSEAIASIRDYFAGRVAKVHVIGVIRLYFASTGPSAPVSMTLAAEEGHTVEHGSGAQIEIPPGATAETTTVTVSEVDPPESPVEVGKVFDFSIVDAAGDDAELQRPVAISLPYHLPKGKTASDVVVLDWNHEAGIWEVIDGEVVDEASGTVTVEVSDLSHKAVAFLLTLPEFLAKTVDQVVEGTLGEHYRRDPETGGLGFKHLVAFKFSKSTPKFNAGATLVLDIDDLARVTDEGEANYATFWINGTVGAGGLSLLQSMPVGMSIFQHKREVNLDDPSFNPSFTVFTADSPVKQISALSLKDGGISPVSSQDVVSCCSGGSVSWADLSFNAVRAELKILPYLDILEGLLESYGHDATVPVPADEFAAELVRKWFFKDGLLVKTVVENSAVPFTSYDSPSPDVLETIDLDYYNQFRNVDEGVWGGIDLNGDGRGDMVFPSEVDNDGIVLNSILKIQLRTDLRQERKYYVELEDLTPGWKIESEHLNPFLRKYYTFREAPNSTVTAEWKVGNDPLAPGEAFATFSLVQDNAEAFGLLDRVVDRVTIRLWKTRAVSDLLVRASGTPGAVAPGKTVTYTVSVTNDGADRAEDAALTVGGLNPAGLVLRSARANGQSQRCDASVSGDLLTCGLGDMDDGETITLTLDFEAVSEPLEAVTATLGFHAASRVYDPVNDNNSAEVTTTVRPPPASGDRAAAFAHKPMQDLNEPANLGIDSPWGIWSDGATMWVSFYYGAHKIYAYDLRTGGRVPSKDFDTLSPAGNDDARGLWSNGQTMWVADRADNRIYAYNMATKARDPGNDIYPLDRRNNRLEGIWSDGAIMWVADLESHKLYAYDLASKSRIPSADIPANFRPTGLWSDGTTIWVADLDHNRIYAYDLKTKNRDESREFDTLSAAGNDNPVGIWSDGETMWVVDVDDDKIFAYQMPPPPASGDRAALVALYRATDGPNWRNNTNWLSDAPLDEWRHVSTDSTGRVIQLDLSNNQLTGEIPPELGNLVNLEWLYLSNNQLTGEIPPELGNLANLEWLYLSSNQLTGEIPVELGSLANLELLRLFQNELTGEIPPELGNLINLTALTLDQNQLTGEIPPELGNLINLTALTLDQNQLTGEIPPELGNLANLEWLYLSSNQLTGEIPPELGSLANLEGLDLGANRLSGEIPAELGNLSNLELLLLFRNELTGEIPAELGNLSNLEQLWLGKNQLSGSIPPELSNIANLNELFLGQNQLSGEIPPELGNLASLELLNLRLNLLTSEIPAELGKLASLTSLDLSGNQLSGEIPAELGNLANLTSLVLLENQLSGEIPVELGNLSNLRLLSMFRNQLSGEIPPELGNLANLTDLYLSNNELTGAIPVELGNLSNLQQLELGGNQLSGEIPTELGNLSSLRGGLFLGYNQLSGEIPPELGNLANLQRLDLHANQLSGAIPAELGNLASLRGMRLYGNQLSGCVPSGLQNQLDNAYTNLGGLPFC